MRTIIYNTLKCAPRNKIIDTLCASLKSITKNVRLKSGRLKLLRETLMISNSTKKFKKSFTTGKHATFASSHLYRTYVAAKHLKKYNNNRHEMYHNSWRKTNLGMGLPVPSSIQRTIRPSTFWGCKQPQCISVNQCRICLNNYTIRIQIPHWNHETTIVSLKRTTGTEQR